jgi:RNA polymerase sigma factor (sigma-70 family)
MHAPAPLIQSVTDDNHTQSEDSLAMAGEKNGASEPKARAFTTTHWSMVAAAAGHHASRAVDEALEGLCRAYWYPIYLFLRRSGWTAHDAEDLTQAFFQRVLEKDYLRAVDRTKGKFRSFLLAMLRHFLANHRRDARAVKRGGRVQFVHIDDESAGEVHPVMTDATPEQCFERQWAITLLEQVVLRLREEHQRAGKAELFEALKMFLTGDKCDMGYAALATRLGTTEAALKMAISRMRRRYGELLRAEVARTVTTPEEANEELRALFAAFR